MQHKRQQIKPSTEVGLRQNKDEEEDSEVSSNNDDSVDNTNETKDSVDNTNETEEPLVSPFLYFLWMNYAVGKEEKEDE